LTIDNFFAGLRPEAPMTITGQGKNTPWGVSGFGLGPIPRFTDPSGHLRAVSRALAQFIELSRVMYKQL
jgi:hypothetical protein